LLVNAFDAVPTETGRIVVSTRIGPTGSTVLLSVSDNGPGIQPEHLGQIFDPFYTTTEIGKGTGLGLTVVHELMRELGGAVEVLGNPGATFVFNFPVEDGMLNPKPLSPQDPA
jgi:signal transduction histidine kinase